MPDITYRKMVDSDIPYIKSTFLKDFIKSNVNRFIPHTKYYDFYSPLFEDILYAYDSRVWLAVNPKDIDHIYAWCVWEKQGPTQILHYVYTKQTYREFGIAKSLLEHAGLELDKYLFFTFPSPIAADLKFKFKNAVYNPFLILQAKES